MTATVLFRILAGRCAYVKETPHYIALNTFSFKFSFNIDNSGTNTTIIKLAERVSLSQSNKSDQNTLCFYHMSSVYILFRVFTSIKPFESSCSF